MLAPFLCNRLALCSVVLWFCCSADDSRMTQNHWVSVLSSQQVTKHGMPVTTSLCKTSITLPWCLHSLPWCLSSYHLGVGGKDLWKCLKNANLNNGECQTRAEKMGRLVLNAVLSPACASPPGYFFGTRCCGVTHISISTWGRSTVALAWNAAVLEAESPGKRWYRASNKLRCSGTSHLQSSCEWYL